ncbi:MAG: CAP domain-containing protein [Arcicella sp.]|nr:CAP domain-containing protein [Arcicella sp.]
MKYLLFLLLLSFRLSAQQKGYYDVSNSEFMNQLAVNQPIDAKNPNNSLLDAAIFHATNEQRLKHNLRSFTYNLPLHKACIGHSEAMIEQDFYSHVNPNNTSNRNLQNRVENQTREFRAMGENIAQHDIIETGKGSRFCFQPPKNNGDYLFVDCATKKPLYMMTYAVLARAIVNGWMNSPHHRENILNPQYTMMAVSARLSKNPFKEPQSPFAKITQDLGGI